MQPTIDPETGRNLLTYLSGEYVIPLCEGKAWLYCTDLPADAVSAAAFTPDGVLHIFTDLNKPDTYVHARAMMREWLGVDCSEAEVRHAVMAQFV